MTLNALTETYCVIKQHQTKPVFQLGGLSLNEYPLWV